MNTPLREALVATCNTFIANAATIDYPDEAQIDKLRPHVYRTQNWLTGYWAGGKHSVWDCSLTCQQATYVTSGNVSGMGYIKDPSGYDYAGWGDTESWMTMMDSYTNPKDAHIGAFVVFGADGPVETQHGCIVIASDFTNGDPTLMSMGSMPGPLSILLSVEQQYHTGATLFLDPTPLGL